MEILLFWYLGLSAVIALFALRNDKIEKGFNPKAKDGDKDGLVQDGTKWERKAKK
jgi:hypothetical protein